MEDKLVDLVVQQVMDKFAGPMAAAKPHRPGSSSLNPGMTEYVGTAFGDTIGIVIANVDYDFHEKLGLDKKYRSIGILSARVGAGPHIMAADEAVKATNTEVVRIELPRDTKGGAGHGSLIIFGAEEVSDARRAIEVALKDLYNAPLVMYMPTTPATLSCNTPLAPALPVKKHLAHRLAKLLVCV
jgi:ethanolamine utilization microcompartment shell protein EutS